MMNSSWRKSSHSASDCLEGRIHDGRVELRDSKAGDRSPVLAFTTAAWTNLLGAVRAGDLSAA